MQNEGDFSIFDVYSRDDRVLDIKDRKSLVTAMMLLSLIITDQKRLISSRIQFYELVKDRNNFMHGKDIYILFLILKISSIDLSRKFM